jgi:hypothetical protein
MRFKSTILALLIGLSLVSLACSKSDGTATNMSDDDKYRLVFAAAKTGDPVIMDNVGKKLGFANPDGTPNEAAKKFMAGGPAWGEKNEAFAKEVDTPEKAKAYVNSHMPQ